MAFFNAQGNINIDVSDAIKNTKSLGSIFNSEMESMSKSARAFHDKITEATYGIKDTKRIVSGILISQSFYAISNAALDASRAVLQFSKDMETSAISMEYFVKGSDKAAKSLAFLREANKLAARTPFVTGDVLAMTRYMNAMGIAVEKTNSVLRVITDAASATGATQQNMERIVFGLGQIQTKGRLANEEIRQLANANIPIYEILREELHMTGEQIANIGRYWIDSEKATNAILTGLEKRYKGAADRIAETMTGMSDTIKDNLLIIAQTATKSGFDGIVANMREMRDYLDDLRETAVQMGSAGVLNKVLIDIDPTGKVGTDILNMIGNIRGLGFTISELYTTAKPTIDMIGRSFYISGQMTIGSLRLIGNTINIVLGAFNKLGMSSEQASRAIATLFISYKVSQAVGVLGQGIALAGHNIRVTALQAINAIPALAKYSIATKAVTATVLGLAGSLGWAYAMWKLLNTTMGGTGEALENSLPSNYQDAYAKFAEDMEKYNDLIAQYQDDFNKPFDDMADSGSKAFNRIEEDAKKTAKAVRDGFIASFDEVYQVNLDTKDSLKDDAIDPVDFGAGLSTPTIKFPSLEMKLPEMPKLDLSAVFGEPLETTVANGDELAQAMWGVLGMGGMTLLGLWKSRFDKPKNPKGGGSGDANTIPKVKATADDKTKVEALVKAKQIIKTTEEKLDEAVKALYKIDKNTKPEIYQSQYKLVENLTNQLRSELQSTNKIEDVMPSVVKSTVSALLDKVESLTNVENTRVMVERLNSIDKTLLDTQIATSEQGDLLRAEYTKLRKDIINNYTKQRNMVDPSALDGVLPSKLLDTLRSLDTRLNDIKKVYEPALDMLRNEGRDSTKFMETLNKMSDEVNSTIKLYEKANIEVPDLLNEVKSLVDTSTKYNKLLIERVELETQIKGDRAILANIRAKRDYDPKDATTLDASLNSLAERQAKVLDELRVIRLRMQHPLQTDTDMLSALEKQNAIDKVFMKRFETINNDINNLFKPLKILRDTNERVLKSFTEPRESVVAALATLTGDKDKYTGVYAEVYDEILAIARDAIKDKSNIKPITPDMFNGIVDKLVTNIIDIGKGANVSDTKLNKLIVDVSRLATNTLKDARMEQLYRDLITIGAKGDIGKVAVKETRDLKDVVRQSVDKLNTLREAVEGNTNALVEFRQDANEIIKNAKKGISGSDWKQISSDILTTKNDIIKQLREQDRLLKVSTGVAKLDPTKNYDRIFNELSGKLYELAEKAEYLNDPKRFNADSRALTDSVKQVYGDRYSVIATEFENLITDLSDELSDKLIVPLREQLKTTGPRETTTAIETKQWREAMQAMFEDAVPKWFTEHNPTKIWPETPWQLGLQSVFRNPYPSGGDIAGFTNESQYEGSQFLSGLIGNLTSSVIDANNLSKPPITISLLDKMVRGRVYEPLLAGTIKEALEIAQDGREGNKYKVVSGGYYIDPTHTIQAQLDNLITLVDENNNILDAWSMDAKLPSEKKFLAITEKFEGLSEDGYDLYWALKNVAPDIAKQFVAQAVVSARDTVFLNMFNGDKIGEVPNYNDYSFFNLSEREQRKAAEAMLEEFHTAAARRGSYVTERGNRVIKGMDIGSAKPIPIKIPKEEMDMVLRQSKTFLNVSAKLVGAAIDGSLKKYLVGYTADGIPLDLYGTSRNMPQIGDMLAEVRKIAFDAADNTYGLESTLMKIFRDLKSNKDYVGDYASQRLTTMIDELMTKSSKAGASDTPITLRLGSNEVTLTPTSMKLLADTLSDIQFQFRPETQLAIRLKTLNDMVNQINGRVGESLIGDRKLHDIIYNAQKSAVAIEKILGHFDGVVSTQLAQIITNQKVQLISNPINFMDLEKWAEHTLKLLAEEEQARGISFDEITKNYQLGVVESRAKDLYKMSPELFGDETKLLELVQRFTQHSNMAGEVVNVLKNIAELGNMTENKTVNKNEPLIGNTVGIKDNWGAQFGSNDTNSWISKIFEGLKGTFNKTVGKWTNSSIQSGVQDGLFGDMYREIRGTTINLGKNKINFGTASQAPWKAGQDGSGIFVDYGAKAAKAKNFINVNDKSLAWDAGYGGLALNVALNAVSKMIDEHAYSKLKSSLAEQGITEFWDRGKKEAGQTIGEYLRSELKDAASGGISNFIEDYFELSGVERSFLGADIFNGGYKYGGQTQYNIGGVTTEVLGRLDNILYGDRYIAQNTTEEYREEYLKAQLALGKTSDGLVQLIDYLLISGDKDSKAAKEFYKVYGSYMDTIIKPSMSEIYAADSGINMVELGDAVEAIASNKEALDQLNVTLSDYGFATVRGREDLTYENMTIISTILEKLRDNIEQQALNNMDIITRYDPVNDNPLLGSVTKLVQGLDVSEIGNKLSTEIANTLGIVFNELAGDDSVTIKTEQAMSNLLGWTQKLPERLTVDNLSADEIAILAKAGIQINSDGTGTFMMAQNDNTTGTTRRTNLTSEDMSDSFTDMLARYGIGLETVAAQKYDGKPRPSVDGSKGRPLDIAEYTKINLDIARLASDMKGAMLQVPTFSNGDSLQASIPPGAIKALEGVIKFYDSGYMEVVDKGVLNGTKTMKQAIDELTASGKLMYGLKNDVYDALTGIDNTFSSQGVATAETIARIADGIRVELDTPIEWFSEEDLAGLAAAGIYIEAEGEKVFATINKLGSIASGVTTLSLVEYNKLTEGTRKALEDMGMVINTEGENVKLNMHGMLNAGLKDVIAIYLNDQGLWDSLPNKVKETMEKNGVYTQEGFLVIGTKTSEGLAQVGNIYAQKWDNISTDTKGELKNLGLTFKNGLLTLQQVAANTPMGEGEIKAKFEDLPEAIQQAITGGDASIAAKLKSDETYYALRDATKDGFMGVAEAVKLSMGDATSEVDQAVKNMTDAMTQAMINLENYKKAASKLSEDTGLAKGGVFGIGKEEYGRTAPTSGAKYTPILKSGKVVAYRVVGTDGVEHRLEVDNYDDAKAAAKNLRIKGAKRGALINSDGLYRAGEFGKDEVVIPLEQASVLNKVGAALAKHIPTGTYNITMARSNLEVALLEDILDVLKQIETKTFTTGLDYEYEQPGYTKPPTFNYDNYEKLDNTFGSVNKVVNGYLATVLGLNNKTYDYVSLLDAINDATGLSSNKFEEMNLSADNYLLALADLSDSTGLTIEQLLGLMDRSGNYRLIIDALAASTGKTTEELFKMFGQTRSTAEMIADLSVKTGVSTTSLQGLINSTGSYNGMIEALSQMTGISTDKLYEFAGSTTGSKSLLDILANTTGNTTQKFLDLIGTSGISIDTLSSLSTATKLSTGEIIALMTASTGSRDMLDILAEAANMSAADFHTHMLAMGVSKEQLARLSDNTGLSAGFLWELAEQTGLTTTDLATMARDYITVMDQMSDASGGARTNILGMSDEHWKQYIHNKQLNEQIFALTGKWDESLSAANEAIRKQYNMETDNFTYMDLILANYKMISDKTAAMVTISDNQYKYLMDLIMNGTPGQAEWAKEQIRNPNSESHQTANPPAQYTPGAYATFDSGVGTTTVPVTIKDGKTITTGLPVGTIITTADGSKYRIDKINADGSYVGSTISSSSSGSSSSGSSSSGSSSSGSSSSGSSSSGSSSSGSSSSSLDEIKRIAREQGVDMGVAKAMADKNKELGYKKYALGGVADYTGPALLHGTKISSETIFNATDSKKLYDLVHNTKDLSNRVANDIASAFVANKMPTAEQVRPLVKIYNVPNGGINTNMSPRQSNVGVTPSPEEFTRQVLETILPAVFNMTSDSQGQESKTPIYVGNLIADRQGLVELERKLYDIRELENTRR